MSMITRWACRSIGRGMRSRGGLGDGRLAIGASRERDLTRRFASCACHDRNRAIHEEIVERETEQTTAPGDCKRGRHRLESRI